MDVSILNQREPLSTGKRYEVKCRSSGARPEPMITWWIAGKQIRDGFHITTSPDGNVSMSTLSFMPTVLDAGSQLVCRAGNPGLTDSTLEDSWKMEVHCEYPDSGPFLETLHTATKSDLKLVGV